MGTISPSVRNHAAETSLSENSTQCQQDSPPDTSSEGSDWRCPALTDPVTQNGSNSIMKKPIAIDFFTGAGGAALGLKRAGFFVIGIDIRKPSAYYGDLFIQADLREGCPVDVSLANFLWASPPCQMFSQAGNANALTRAELFGSHPLTCIENVEHAPIRPDLVLYGQHFGMDKIRRKRVFELSFHFWHSYSRTMPYTHDTIPVCRGTPSDTYKNRKRKGLHPVISVAEKLEAMGLSDYPMQNGEVANAVAPAYSEFIGQQALKVICGTDS